MMNNNKKLLNKLKEMFQILKQLLHKIFHLQKEENQKKIKLIKESI